MLFSLKSIFMAWLYGTEGIRVSLPFGRTGSEAKPHFVGLFHFSDISPTFCHKVAVMYVKESGIIDEIGKILRYLSSVVKFLL